MKIYAIVVLVLAAMPAKATDFSKASNDQLCVAYAETLITGRGFRYSPFKRVPGEAIKAELEARQVTCEPADSYMQAAQYRLAERERNRAAVIEALQDYSNQPYAAPPANAPSMPQRTNCRLVGQNLNCTTW